MTHPFPRCLLALGGTALALPMWVQAQTVQMYGQIRLSADSVRTGSAAAVHQLKDNASRFGVKGREDLGDGQAVHFGLEMGLDATTGASASPTYRNAYLAWQGPWGHMALGRLDSANPTGSPLYSQVTALVPFAPNDAGSTAIGTSMLNARNRTSNALGYASPRWAGWDLKLRYYQRGAVATPDVYDGSHSFDGGLNYQQGALKLALGWGLDRRAGGLRANEMRDKWQVGARYDFGQLEPYVLLGRERFNAAATARAQVDYALVGVKWDQGPHAVVLNLMQKDVQSAKTGERRRYQLAYTYALFKRSQLQAFMDRDGVNSARSGVAVRAVGVGLRHDF